MEINNDYLKEKFRKVAEEFKEECPINKEAAELHEDSKETSVRFAYVVFRSMEAMNHVENAYKVGACKRFWTMKCGCCCR